VVGMWLQKVSPGQRGLQCESHAAVLRLCRRDFEGSSHHAMHSGRPDTHARRHSPAVGRGQVRFTPLTTCACMWLPAECCPGHRAHSGTSDELSNSAKLFAAKYKLHTMAQVFRMSSSSQTTADLGADATG
jgi:hypothetical protein